MLVTVIGPFMSFFEVTFLPGRRWSIQHDMPPVQAAMRWKNRDANARAREQAQWLSRDMNVHRLVQGPFMPNEGW